MSKSRKYSSRSWDPVADWYIGWVGAKGSDHHRTLAIPATMDLLGDIRGRHVLDIGCGTGAVAAHVSRRGGQYTGVDKSRRLVDFARRHHGTGGRVIHGDATRLDRVAGLARGGFDAAVFLLSLQDIDPLRDAMAGAAWALRPGGKAVVLMTHPCFRIPRQSGWGWDPDRRLQFRRVDRYLTPLAVPMKAYGRNRKGATWSHHRPLEAYVDAMVEVGLLLESIREIPAPEDPNRGSRSRAERRANVEIPLFMGIRATKGRNGPPGE
jgi:SAM-dependent methyltransferase